MKEKLMNGKEVAEALSTEIIAHCEEVQKERCLVVISAGDDPASKVYINKKKEAAEKFGYDFVHESFSESIDEKILISTIKFYAEKDSVKGILVQLPLPKHINTDNVIKAIPSHLDVDGFSYENLGKVLAGDDTGFISCTPNGIMYLLKHYDVEIEGKHCVVVGRSNEVGKPMAMLMLNKNATVTICHSKTKDLSYHTKQADILIVAVGKAGLITADMIKEGAVVVDVGINRNSEGKLCGDVNRDEKTMEKVSLITPVPGGVGPMTVASLMHNVIARDLI